MKKEQIGLRYKNREEKLEVKVVPKWFEGIGLMFSRREKAEALFFKFRKEVGLRIHSFFVFYSFVAIWMDENKKVIEVKTVKPFSLGIKPKKDFKFLLEVPINRKYDDIINMLVGGKETFK